MAKTTKNYNVDKSFRDWKRDELHFLFGLRPKKGKCPFLEDWLSSTTTISDFETKYLETLYQKAVLYVDYWQEAELRDNFISPLVSFIDFNSFDNQFSTFSERKISAVKNNIALKGKVEWLVAMGQNDPNIPFFFIHEYKQEEGQAADGKGQLLAAMLAAQTLHKKPSNTFLPIPFLTSLEDMPVYGCYVLGRMWFFIVLYDKEYCVSKNYDITDKEDLWQVVRILKAQKELIINTIKEAKSKMSK